MSVMQSPPPKPVESVNETPRGVVTFIAFGYALATGIVYSLTMHGMYDAILLVAGLACVVYWLLAAWKQFRVWRQVKNLRRDLDTVD